MWSKNYFSLEIGEIGVLGTPLFLLSLKMILIINFETNLLKVKSSLFQLCFNRK